MAEINPYWRNCGDWNRTDGGTGGIDMLDPVPGDLLAERTLSEAADVEPAVQTMRRMHLSGERRDMPPIKRDHFRLSKQKE